MSLHSRCVLLDPEDQPLLGRLSNPGTETNIRSGLDWNGTVRRLVKGFFLFFYRRSRLPVFPGRTLETKWQSSRHEAGGLRNDCGHLVWFLPLVPPSLHLEPLCLPGALEIPPGPERGDGQHCYSFKLGAFAFVERRQHTPVRPVSREHFSSTQ